MKQLYLFCGAFILLLISDCKKGPEDPFLSFHSRLHRVCGDWEITKFTVNSADSLRRLVDSTMNSGAYGPQLEKHINFYNFTWSFDKNGGFNEKLVLIKEDWIDVINDGPYDTFEKDTFISTTNYNWSFAGGIGDYKNKEQLYIYNPATALSQIFNIIELREKEMKLETEFLDSISNEVMVKSYTLSAIK